MQNRISNLNDYYNQEKNELNLSCKGITDQDIVETIIPFLISHQEITSLNLSQNYCIDDEGAKALAVLPLTILNLRNNRISDKGAKALATNDKLTTLDISLNELTADGAIAVASHPNLTELLISGNNIGITGVMALASNTRLIKLAADANNYGHNGKAILQETNPTKRANNGRIAGMQTEVPSLLRLSLFKIKNLSQLDKSTLPADLLLRFEQPKF